MMQRPGPRLHPAGVPGRRSVGRVLWTCRWRPRADGAGPARPAGGARSPRTGARRRHRSPHGGRRGPL